MKKCTVFAVSVMVLLYTLCGCGALPPESCLDYMSGPFTLEGRLDCAGCEYTLTLEYCEDETLLVKIGEPERIAGCVLSLSPDGKAELSLGGLTVTVAEKENILNYGALVALRELVLPPKEGLLSVELVKLGNRTYNLAVFESPRGKVSVWFDSKGIPVRFGADDMTLSVTSYARQTADTAETEETVGPAA